MGQRKGFCNVHNMVYNMQFNIIMRISSGEQYIKYT